jgi:NAD(P)H-hydrate epimerase
MYILTAKQMDNIDRRTSEKYGVLSSALMRNAGKSVYLALGEKIRNFLGKDYIVFCGTGNNGGDGYETARLLLKNGASVFVVSIGDPKDNKSDAAVMRSRYLKAGGIILDAETFLLEKTRITKDSVLIDALFGTGLNAAIRKIPASVVKWINEANAYVVSVDIPSGVHCDSGRVLGVAVKANITVTFCMRKIAHILKAAREYCGEVMLKDIGIPEQAIIDEKPNICAFEKRQANEIMPILKYDEHKGTNGRLLVVGGSKEMSGAIVMAASAAMRAGSGIVKMVVPENIWMAVMSRTCEVMISPVKHTIYGTLSKQNLEEILTMSEKFDAMVIGCGMAVNENTKESLYGIIQSCTKPMVIDADGINIVAQNLDILAEAQAPIVLTPHIVEMSRLCGLSVEELKRDLIEIAIGFAK